MPFNPIERTTEDNIGGGIYVLIADLDWIDVANFPDIFDHNYEDPIPLLEGYEWSKYELTEESISYVEEEIDFDGGRGYQTILQGLHPKDRLDLQRTLDEDRKRKCIALFYNANAQIKVFGYPDAPANFSVKKVDHGQNRSDLNSCLIEIEISHRDRPPFYQFTPSEVGSTCEPALVKNSNNTWSQYVASGGEYILPDTTVNVIVDGVPYGTETIVPEDPATIINITW